MATLKCGTELQLHQKVRCVNSCGLGCCVSGEEYTVTSIMDGWFRHSGCPKGSAILIPSLQLYRRSRRATHRPPHATPHRRRPHCQSLHVVPGSKGSNRGMPCGIRPAETRRSATGDGDSAEGRSIHKIPETDGEKARAIVVRGWDGDEKDYYVLPLEAK